MVLLMVAILTGMRWNLSVVLICISFMAREISIFSYVFKTFGCPPLKKFCSVQLPMPIASSVFHALSFTNFKISGLILWSLIHFEMILNS
jgi:hypothetical protein